MLRLARRSVGPRARNSSRVSEVGGLVHWWTESTILPGMMCSHWPVMPERTCTDTTSRPHLNNHPYALQPMSYSLGPPDTQPSLGTSPLQPYTHPYCPGTHTWETTPHPPTYTQALGTSDSDLCLGTLHSGHTASARIWTNLASLPLPYEWNLPSDRTLPDFTSNLCLITPPWDHPYTPCLCF